MSPLNEDFVIIDAAGDMHKGKLSTESKRVMKELMFGLIGEKGHDVNCQAVAAWRKQIGDFKDTVDAFSGQCDCGETEMEDIRQKVHAL